MKLIGTIPAVFFTNTEFEKPFINEKMLYLTRNLSGMWNFMYKANNVADPDDTPEWMHHQTSYMADLRAATQSTLGILDQAIGTAKLGQEIQIQSELIRYDFAKIIAGLYKTDGDEEAFQNITLI